MRTICSVLFLIIYLVLSLPVQGILWIYQKKNREKADYISLRIVQWGFRVIQFFSGVKPEIKGLENIPEDEPVLFVGNHLGFFDVILTYPLMKRRTGYIAKKEFEKVPLLPIWMKRLYCIFLDRSNPKEGLKGILEAISYVKEGVSIFIFPEGTRSRDGKLGEFKAGALKISQKTKCPIIPVAITGTDDVFENHFPWIKKRPVQITFCEAIYPDALEPEDKKHLSDYTHRKLEEYLREQRG
ncbi:MAG: 1-acyl-sn-glycerol-3-phosphate acyltransferase [Lachnospiraceae bacterium]|nr:1-acyl-sn-glycerol-3-phosphate acyltransferase [Lachnospiraceae bacterium]